MNDADRELAELLKRNPELSVVSAAAPRPMPEAAKRALARLQPSEHEEQVALFAWAALSGIPELRWMFSIPNGGYRHPATAYKMKSEGQKPGVPDICIAVPMPPYNGAYIELKRSDHSNHATDEQNEWLAHLNAAGYFVATCYGCEEAIAAILEYLGIA